MPQNFKSAKKMKAPIHCPVSGCLYSFGSERHFTEKKFLNQHYAKVHAEKKFSCTKCQKSFGLDWWRKHHEKTCGMEWKCDCGIKYTSRETLLTHARRNDHKLPDYIISTDKTKHYKSNENSGENIFILPDKNLKKTNENPVVVLIQTFIQNVTCIEPTKTTITNSRPILPKPPQPLLQTLPINMGYISPSTPNNAPCVNYNWKHEPSVTSVITEVASSPIFSSSSLNSAQTNNQLFTNSSADVNSSVSKEKDQKTVSTQTVADAFSRLSKMRQSQASQCSRRKPKSLKVGIESTHTQTAESAVIKIKKKRSRKKSVAITTEQNLLTLPGGNSLWPGFNDFFAHNSDNLSASSVKSSAGTQTHMCGGEKVLCDSETLTDSDLIQLAWEQAVKQDDVRSTCTSTPETLADSGSSNSLPSGIDNTLPNLNLFSASLNEVETSTNEIIDDRTKSPEKIPNENIFSVFNSSVKTEIQNNMSGPNLSNIYTQTINDTFLDYNLLANMETQTTDDITLSDLEFSDTETQTPWEYFPNLDDSPMPADQLSIEIQTDFDNMDLDPYELINSVDVQNMITSCPKETSGINIETQTLDQFTFPQFTSNTSISAVNTETQTLDHFSFPQLTNSESQTLDIPDFIFGSLN